MKAADVVLSAGGSFDERRALDMLCVEHSKPSLVLAASGYQGSLKTLLEGKGIVSARWIRPKLGSFDRCH
jgi:molybdopterin/thiamine biosynthesis adenylyltransferase